MSVRTALHPTARLHLSRAAATFWGPGGRAVVDDILRTLPPRAAEHPVHLVLIDPIRGAAAWVGSWNADPDPGAEVEAPCRDAQDLRECSVAEAAAHAPALGAILAPLAGPADARCFPLRKEHRLLGLFVAAASGRTAADLRRHARLAAAALLASQRSVEEQRELEGYRALSHLLDAGTPRNRKALAQALGRSMAAVTRARICMILARGNEGEPLGVIGSRGYPARKAAALLVWPQEPPWSDLLTTEHPFMLDPAQLDRAWQEVLGERPAIVAPIHWKGWLRALLIMPSDTASSGGAHLIDPARLASVAAHAGLLWQNAELIQRLRRDEEVLQGLMHRAVQVQEEERRRIASDIHDGVTQRIISIWYRLLNLEKVMVRSLDEARDELATIKVQLDAALQEARAAIYHLRPMTLDDLGLVPSLRSLVHEFEKETGSTAVMQVRGERRLPGYIEVGIYRIAQEALRNVKKHAQATSVKIMLHLGEETVRLTVSDDGRGFQRKRRAGPATLVESFGLESMQERAQMMGADLFVRSHPGEGTSVRVALRVPLEAAAAP